MAIIRLVLKRPVANARREPVFVPASATLSRTYFPTRGVFYSLALHAVGFTLLNLFAYFPIAPPPEAERPREQIVMIDLNDPLALMYFPLEPEDEAPAPPGKKAEPQREEPSGTPAATTRGFSYPGPQLIVSDVPEPTNEFQTILQPDIENPPVLPPPVAVPNIVQLAEVNIPPPMEEPPEEPAVEEEAPQPQEPEPEPKPEPKPVEPPKPEPQPVAPPKVPEPKPEPEPEAAPKPEPEPPKPAPKPVEIPKPEPKPEPKPAPKPEPPKPPEPAPRPVETPKPKPDVKPVVAKPEPKPVERPKPATPKVEPKRVETAPAENRPDAAAPAADAPPGKADPGAGPDTPGAVRDILALSPMPAAPDKAASIPVGEARGQFVISPEPNLNSSEAGPGLSEGSPAAKIGVGKAPGGAARVVSPKVEPGAAKGPAVSGGPGSGSSAGGGTGAAGGGNGPGAGKGPAGKMKPFAGITIMGGDYQPGPDPDVPPVQKARRPLQTAYGLSVISTEDSGGGLPFYGVFEGEQIYTVYLDMREVETEEDPSWILEFAAIRNSNPAPSAVVNLSRKKQGLVLPFPKTKEKPALPVDVVRKHLGKMIVVYAIVNLEGKMEQITIKDSPDPLLNEPVISALSKWVFRPAQLEGAPAAAKLLMGIPLWLPR